MVKPLCNQYMLAGVIAIVADVVATYLQILLADVIAMVAVVTEMKSFYFGGSISVGEQICCKCKFFIFVLYFLIFTSVFTDSYVIFIYICYADLVSCIVFDFMIEKDKNIPS